MLRVVRYALLLSLVATEASVARAANFAIDLSARAGKVSRDAQAVNPDAKVPPRAVLNAEINAPITLRWTLRNMDKDTTAKDVLVHVFVVKQETLDQAEVPKLNKSVLVESALTMDFKPQDRTEGEITFSVHEAGCYLIRLELKGVAGKGEREAFAALDLLVR
jgi:hypothetical protein